MYFSKVREVKSPTRANPEDTGIDFYMPIFDSNFVESLKEKNPSCKYSINDEFIMLYPHERILIPSGIHVNLEKTKELTNWAGISLNAHNKSGVASKKGLIFGSSVVDELYQGEVHISLINTSNETVTIKESEKIIQFVLEETVYLQPLELPFETLYDKVSNRGAGGFGSTDKI